MTTGNPLVLLGKRLLAARKAIPLNDALGSTQRYANFISFQPISHINPLMSPPSQTLRS